MPKKKTVWTRASATPLPFACRRLATSSHRASVARRRACGRSRACTRGKDSNLRGCKRPAEEPLASAAAAAQAGAARAAVVPTARLLVVSVAGFDGPPRQLPSMGWWLWPWGADAPAAATGAAARVQQHASSGGSTAVAVARAVAHAEQTLDLCAYRTLTAPGRGTVHVVGGAHLSDVSAANAAAMVAAARPAQVPCDTVPLPLPLPLPLPPGAGAAIVPGERRHSLTYNAAQRRPVAGGRALMTLPEHQPSLSPSASSDPCTACRCC